MCERFRSSPALQAPKQLPTVTGTSFSGDARGRQFVADRRIERRLSLPAAPLAAAGEDLVLGDPLDGPVQHVLQHRAAAQHVGGEDLVDQLAIDPLVLDRHLAGHEDADDRLAAAAAGAAGAMQEDVAAARGGDVLAELVEHFVGPGGLLARGRADLDPQGAPRGLLFEEGLGLVGQKLVLLGHDGGHDGSYRRNGRRKRERNFRGKSVSRPGTRFAGHRADPFQKQVLLAAAHAGRITVPLSQIRRSKQDRFANLLQLLLAGRCVRLRLRHGTAAVGQQEAGPEERMHGPQLLAVLG